MASIEDFSYILENSQSEVILNNDGSAIDFTTWDYKITKDSGLENLSLFKMSFDPGSEKMKGIMMDSYSHENVPYN